jgi:hypothetical protein
MVYNVQYKVVCFYREGCRVNRAGDGPISAKAIQEQCSLSWSGFIYQCRKGQILRTVIERIKIQSALTDAVGERDKGGEGARLRVGNVLKYQGAELTASIESSSQDVITPSIPLRESPPCKGLRKPSSCKSTHDDLGKTCGVSQPIRSLPRRFCGTRCAPLTFVGTWGGAPAPWSITGKLTSLQYFLGHRLFRSQGMTGASKPMANPQ